MKQNKENTKGIVDQMSESYYTQKLNKSVNASGQKFMQNSPMKASESYYSLKKKFVSEAKSKSKNAINSNLTTSFTNSNSKNIKLSHKSNQRQNTAKMSLLSKKYMKPLEKQSIDKSKQNESIETKVKAKVINQDILDKASLLYLREMQRLNEKDHRRQLTLKKKAANEINNCSFRPETLTNGSFQDNAE
jgi:hypothetical protein